MEEQDYIELNTLLGKLRVICLKELWEWEQRIEYPCNDEINRLNRQNRERLSKTIRYIDSIRKNMPLKIGDGSISVN